MNSKKNSNAIRRYSNTSVYYADNNTDKCYVSNPIKSVSDCNAFKLFTNNLEYYKIKYQHKHFDNANEPYQISFDKSRRNAYIKWSNVHDVEVSGAELNTINRVILMALDIMSERAIKLTCKSVRSFITKEVPGFYFNGVDLPSVIREYKKRNEIKHRADNECLVFRPKKSTISIGAKKLGTVVGM